MLFDPLAQTIAAYDKISGQYSEQWFKSEVVQDFFARFLSYLNEMALVLDAGCGSGREVKELRERGTDCVGIDLSYETVKRARYNVGSGFFRVMDIRNLDYPDDLFDGLLCIAVLHHLFDRDFKKALLQFHRVTKAGAVLALTIRLGDGYLTDGVGRTVVLRDEETIDRIIKSAGFSVLESHLSPGRGDQLWLQLILSNDKDRREVDDHLCGFCRDSFFLKENRTAGAPVAASVLWGDEQYLVTMDVAPLMEGHILLATNRHILSTLGTGQDLARLTFHKMQIDHVIKKAFNKKPVFLEHGSFQQGRDPCIEHAHIHALPLRGELRNQLQKRLGRLTKFQNLSRADQAVEGLEYLAYENKRGQIFIKTDGVAELPSQFMRQIVAGGQGNEEYLWVLCRDNPDVRRSYNVALAKIIDVLDAEVLSREIVSDIPQEVRSQLGRLGRRGGREPVFSKTGRRVVAKITNERPGVPFDSLTLDNLGEHGIVRNIFVPYFDSGYRGASYIGDDAAVFPWNGSRLLATSDHCPVPMFFGLGIESYEAYGWLSMVISLSDIAAMGGEPRAVLLNTEMPPQMRVVDYLSFIEGVSFAANAYGVRVIGGNIRESQHFSAATTILGEIGRGGEFRRDSAEPGHALFVVGEMGLFWAGVLERYHNLLLPLANHKEIEAGLLFPEPKLAAAQLLAGSGVVGACMDASDGPTQAVQSLARASGCDLVVDVDLVTPNQSIELVAKYRQIDPLALMFTWGNFELVFTARESELYKSVGSDLSSYKIRKIGYVRSGRGRALLSSAGKRIALPLLSIDQFSGSRKQSIPEYEEMLRNARFR